MGQVIQPLNTMMNREKHMTEQEYINATNRVKVSAALTLLRDVLVMKDSPVYTSEFSQALADLREIEENLYSSYELH